MGRSRLTSLLLALLMFTAGAGVGHASLLSFTLGTPGAGIADGDQLSIGDWVMATPAALRPFDGFDNGSGPSAFAAPFTFNYAVIAEPILSATFTLGIYDHDSAAALDQVASFTLDSSNLAASLNTAFNASGGTSVFVPDPLVLTNEYNVYTIALTSFADLPDGSLTATLNLQNGFAFPLGVPTATAFNGASIDFARLDIETQNAQAIPEPSSFVLFLIGIAALAGVARLGAPTFNILQKVK